MRYLCAFLLFMTLGAHGPLEGQKELGSVSGTVLDGAGKPLDGATVFALPAEDMTDQIRAVSGSSGRFSLTGLPAGTVYIDAFKEADGYPYNFFSFFKVPGARTPVSIEVVAGKETTNVDLHLGPRSAYLQLEISSDDGTAVDGELLFDRPDIRGPYRRGVNAHELVMVPPVPFRLTFEAPGYLPWRYGGDRWNTSSGLIKLKSGETLNLVIYVKRALPSK